MVNHAQAIVRPDVSETEATRIARECYGLDATASELGSNQDRNFLIEESSGRRTVLRVDNPIFTDDERDAQHAAILAYAKAGVPVPAVIPGLDGAVIQRWNGFAVRLSEFAEGETLVDAGYLAPVVLAEFGALAAASVNALAGLTHPGLEVSGMWDMRLAVENARAIRWSIGDAELRGRIDEALHTTETALEPFVDRLPVQAIHGDLTDDNVMGMRGGDARIHPHTVLDLGDLAYGWRVAELAVTVSSLLHHEPERPLRTLDTIAAFHAAAPLTADEAQALWPLVVARAALLVASGHRQLEVDGDNEYARARVAGEQAIFDSAVKYPLAEMTEHVLARLGFLGAPGAGGSLQLVALPRVEAAADQDTEGADRALRTLLSGLSGPVALLDLGVESAELDAGAWLRGRSDECADVDAEAHLVRTAVAEGAGAAVFPYGVYRLTRTLTNSVDAAATWSTATEIWVPQAANLSVHAPVAGEVSETGEQGVTLDISGGWKLRVTGVAPAVRAGDSVELGDRLGDITAPSNGAKSDAAPADTVADAAPGGLAPLVVTCFRTDAMPLVDALQAEGSTGAPLVIPERVPAWNRFTADPARMLGLPQLAQRDESGDELARRERIFASAQERYYERPMQIERGWKHHLIDTTGRAYVDVVNNVTGLGHSHPGVADAANRQIRTLSTNSRFLYRQLAEYSERLLELLPRDGDLDCSHLDTVLLVNSGSEAVDLALRLAQAATGRRTVVALREAYHGWTMASDAVTTSAFDNPYALDNRPDWVHIADVPNRFRGTYRGTADDLTVGAQYAADLGDDLAALASDGRDVAGFICESVLGNAGGVVMPEGYLADVYARVRAAGGLCIADEIQVGFGRMGSSFWGFEQSGVVPDIITIAKPMGNGFPIGGVITSKKIADALSSQGQFFSSAGGNPLACAVGLAVLDAMRDENLQENARRIGERLQQGFAELAKKHDLVGPVHGVGLYLGVELVRDRETMEPATAETAAICERLKELGVIVLSTSERSNVLKVKPPLTLSAESADFVVAQIDRVLIEGW